MNDLKGRRLRVLVTGGLGFVGSHVSVELLNSGHDLVIVDNLYNSTLSVVDKIKKITGRNVAFFEGDVRDKNLLRSIFAEFQPDAVMHFAGLKSVGESVLQPLRYYEWNVSASVTLLQVMKEADVKTLVFSSSATVYGHLFSSPVDEEAPISPTNPYGNSKAIIEQIVADMVNTDPTWSVARLRYFNPVGAHPSALIGEKPKGVPNNLMPYVAQVAAGTLPELKVFGIDYNTPDGTGIRDYIHVVDLAEGHVAALNYLQNKSGLLTINLGTGRGHSVLDMIGAMERVSGKRVPYRVVERRSGDVAQCVADVSRAFNLLGWEAKLELDEICRDLWRWQTSQI